MSAPAPEATRVCLGCGRAIPISYVACPHCGTRQQAMPPQPAPQATYAQPAPQVVYAQPAPQPMPQVVVAQPATRTCLGCGLQIPLNYNVCPHCGKPVMYGGGGQRDSSMPIVAGVMNVLGMIIAFGVASLFFIGGSLLFFAGGGILYICGVIPLIGAIFHLIAAINNFGKKSYKMALICSIIGMIFDCEFIFGLIAVILVAISKDAYSS